MEITWHLKPWATLTTSELYEILALRISVFVIEQNCPYQDADGKDQKSLHLYGMSENGKCMACLRLVQPGISYDEWSIGRVATDTTHRREGWGKELMKRAMKYFSENGNPAIRISAQSYLEKFYEGFGFVKVSEEYMEDDIPHIEMLFQPKLA